MKFVLITPPQQSEWDAFVASASNPSLLQSYAWAEVKRGAWQAYHAAVLADDGTWLMAALILKRPLPLVGRCIFYCPRGPVFQKADPAVLNFFFEAVRGLASQEKAFAFRCDPEISETDSAFVQTLKSAGLRRNPENIQPRATIVLDIRPDEATLLQSFHHKTRYNIKLAEKKGVVVEEKNSREGVDIFYDLFKITSERDHFLILQRNYFHHLRETLAAKGQATIFVASYDGKPLGAIFQTLFGGRMTYLYGASSNEHRNLMPNHLIHWRAIQWARSHGATAYDFWGIPASATEDSPLAGVYRFKKGFCETETRWIGTYERVFSPFWYFVFEHGARWFKTVVRFLKTGKIKQSLGE